MTATAAPPATPDTDQPAPKSYADRQVEAEQAADLAEQILARVIDAKGGSRRAGQIHMTRSVARSLVLGVPLAIEAGTGTGKSIGYLCGGLASGKQIVVAPHTKALQDQLASDLDLIREAFPEDDPSPLEHAPTFAVVKGRASYLCLNKVRGVPEEQDGLIDVPAAPTSPLGKEVMALHKWADTTETGDRSDVDFAITSRAWEKVSTGSEACTGKHCPFYADCFAEKARQKARDADVIVTNQSYLAMALRLPMLPADAAVVVDEAHEFPSVVAGSFGAQVSASRLLNVLKKTLPLDTVDAKRATAARESAEAAAKALDKAAPTPKNPDRDLITKPAVTKALEAAVRHFDDLTVVATAMPEGDEVQKGRKDIMTRMLDNVVFDLKLLIRGTDDKQVAWVEPSPRQESVLRSAQYDVADTIFERLLKARRSVVFTSATLTVGGRFEHPAKTLGMSLGPWTGEVVESPFDFEQQALVWLPKAMPVPKSGRDANQEYLAAVGDVAEKVIRAAGGRTLVLCTSTASVQTIGAHLRSVLGSDYPVLTQEPGESAKHIAVEFARNPRSVLVGTRTFWTGISVEGDACTAVVIDKLPFPSPGEPIISARGEKVERDGGSGFEQVFLAEACLTVVQGAGRLIRTTADRGLIVICDPRVNPTSEYRKRYGQTVLRSLPPIPVAGSEEEALDFLRKIDARAAAAPDAAAVVQVEADLDDTEVLV